MIRQLFRQATRRAVVGAMTATLLVALVPGVASAVSRPTRFDLSLGMSCVGGVASDGMTVNVLWRRPNGKVLAQDAYKASTNGGYWEACAISSGRPRVLKVGDHVEARVGMKTHRLTIPDLTLRLNRATDVFRGRAPAGSTIELNYLEGLYADFEVQRYVTANSDGVWVHRPRNFDILGGQYAYATWRSSSDDTISVDGVAPFVRVTLDGSFFRGADYPGTLVRFTLTDPATGAVAATARATASQDHSFAGHFVDASGNAVALTAGLRLRARELAGDADWIVPDVSATASASSDVVSGRCFDAGTSDGWVWVDVIAQNGSHRGYAGGSTSSDGTFEIDFSDPHATRFYDPADVMPGNAVMVRCLQTAGDWVQRRVVAP